jgi:hypothetical protein
MSIVGQTLVGSIACHDSDKPLSHHFDPEGMSCDIESAYLTRAGLIFLSLRLLGIFFLTCMDALQSYKKTNTLALPLFYFHNVNGS